MANTTPAPDFFHSLPELTAIQTHQDFLELDFPEKTPLIDRILFRRDQISLTGRRRNGKTSFLLNLAIAGARGDSHYLGFPIPRPFRPIVFFLEDDPREIQDKIARMQATGLDNFALYTRIDFLHWDIPIAVTEKRFQAKVVEICDAFRPDFIGLDNLSALVGAQYSDVEEIHKLTSFTFGLTQRYDAACLVAAHPRKNGGMDQTGTIKEIDLETAPEAFFEATMGSSHFINSTGSLWGIQRKNGQDVTTILLGSQRVTGGQTFTKVELNDSGWFELSADQQASAYISLCATPRRQAALTAISVLPSPFSWLDAHRAASTSIKSKSAFSEWFRELLRSRIIEEIEEKRYKISYKPRSAAKK
jgi:hypothetical protein